jgi:hypothetical protein
VSKIKGEGPASCGHGADGGGDAGESAVYGSAGVNRQFTDHREAVPGDRRTSAGPVRIWNSRADWVVHRERTHPALVSDEDFTAVQEITARATLEGGQQRRYALICETCGRRMAGHWVNGRAGYRCRHGHTSAQPAAEGAPRWLYRSEARLVQDLIAANPRTGRSGGCRRCRGVSEGAGLGGCLRSRGSGDRGRRR